MREDQIRGAPDKRFFSIQPFWGEQSKDVHIWNDPYLQFTGQLFHRCWTENTIDSVPGVGLVGVIFSCDPNHPCAYCYGVLKDRRIALPLHGINDGIFIRFSPGEFTRLFGIPCNEVPADGIALEMLTKTGSIPERMALAGDWPTRHRLLFELLLHQRLQTSAPKQNELEIARLSIDLIQHNNGNIRIKELERQTLYSARYLQNVLQRQIGLSPKQLCDQIRFQNALRLMNSPDGCNSADLSQLLGYCDQSHFIRAFREYMDMSPSAFLKLREAKTVAPN